MPRSVELPLLWARFLIRLSDGINEPGSLQLGVLRLGFLEDEDIGVGVFPEGEEIPVCDFGVRGVAGDDVAALPSCTWRALGETQDQATAVKL